MNAAPLSSVYGSSNIKRHRRTKAEIESLKDGLYRIVATGQPMTVRQVFYQAVVAGLVDKTEAEYNRTVVRLLLEMRRTGEIPYRWIADNARWMRKPKTYTGLDHFIKTHQAAYRRNLWAESDTYVEVWCEKEALAGVLLDVTAEYDVPLMVSRGFASESYLYEAADQITTELSSDGSALEAIIYYFGDHDPSGLRISESIEAGLRRICPQVLRGFDQDWLRFVRVAVTEEQIEAYQLPTRPTKLAGNCHAAGWKEDAPSVELDAIEADLLRALVRHCIEQHVDHDQLDHLRVVEATEREQLQIFGRQIEARAGR